MNSENLVWDATVADKAPHRTRRSAVLLNLLTLIVGSVALARTAASTDRLQVVNADGGGRGELSVDARSVQLVLESASGDSAVQVVVREGGGVHVFVGGEGAPFIGVGAHRGINTMVVAVDGGGGAGLMMSHLISTLSLKSASDTLTSLIVAPEAAQLKLNGSVGPDDLGMSLQVAEDRAGLESLGRDSASLIVNDGASELGLGRGTTAGSLSVTDRCSVLMAIRQPIDAVRRLLLIDDPTEQSVLPDDTLIGERPRSELPNRSAVEPP